VAELPDTVPRESVMFAVDEAADEDLLAAVLDEVIYQMEVYGRLPADVSIDERTGATAGQVEVRFAAVPVEEVAVIGAVPKAVSLHELRFARAGGAWRCHVTVDV
jgi:SHS2 domain-containing protein